MPSAASGPEPISLQLSSRLAALGRGDWGAGDDQLGAWELWRELYSRWGRRVTLIDLYELEARARGVPVSDLTEAERSALAQRVFEAQFPGFARVATDDRGREPVLVVEPDPAWPAAFSAWRQRLRGALGRVALRIDHVGSTSVPGLAAKPIVDIQVSVRKLGEERRYAPALGALRLELRARDDWHRFFCPPRGVARDVQVHVCERGGTWERDHLLFRDYLRSHPAVRRHYVELKRQLAERWRDDRFAYTDAKGGFIQDQLEAARAWAARSGWHLP